MFDAPSPKLVTATLSSPRTCAASARPLAMGMPLPTMPVVTTTPLSGWVMCIGPPLPLHDPVVRPAYSAHNSRRSEEHTSELQSLMRSSYAVFCLKQKTSINHIESTYSKPTYHIQSVEITTNHTP